MEVLHDGDEAGEAGVRDEVAAVGWSGLRLVFEMLVGHQGPLAVVEVVSPDDDVCVGVVHGASHGLVVPNSRDQRVPRHQMNLSPSDLAVRRRRDVSGLGLRGWR